MRFPQGFQRTRKHGQKILTIMEQKENKAGNKGEKALHVSDVLGNRVHHLIENILLGKREHKGKFVGNKGTWTVLGRPQS